MFTGKLSVKQRKDGVGGWGGGLSLQQMSGDRKSGEIIENTIKLIKKKDLSSETAAALPTGRVHLKVKCILPT